MSPVPEGKRRMQDFYITQKSVQFKIYELFISGIFNLIFWDRNWPQENENVENAATDKEDNCTQ